LTGDTPLLYRFIRGKSSRKVRFQQQLTVDAMATPKRLNVIVAEADFSF
jgi:hypothetical protein